VVRLLVLLLFAKQRHHKLPFATESLLTKATRQQQNKTAAWPTPWQLRSNTARQCHSHVVII
jgi:hypothetical protein